MRNWTESTLSKWLNERTIRVDGTEGFGKCQTAGRTTAKLYKRRDKNFQWLTHTKRQNNNPLATPFCHPTSSSIGYTAEINARNDERCAKLRIHGLTSSFSLRHSTQLGWCGQSQSAAGHSSLWFLFSENGRDIDNDRWFVCIATSRNRIL